ncbi:sporulation initiation factor Spo0A C-terminal domain-containing protein [Bacillus altitudinis]|uniref:sporulation initiation factor Spo0A C-terminal domain-containing protein n=1 Tax=Bacillus altitudinis TaxID=293387 RepID=UPI003B52D2CA
MYPHIPNKFNTTPTRLQPPIPHPIQLPSTTPNIHSISSLFPYTLTISKPKPTNSQFIPILPHPLPLDHTAT